MDRTHWTRVFSTLLFVGLLAGAFRLTRGDCEGEIAFDQTVYAVDKNTLAWVNPADVDYVKGALSAVHGYDTWGRGSLVSATALNIAPDLAGPGYGFYYLVKPSGPPCGSWQTMIGAEPERDIKIHPACSEVNPADLEIEWAVEDALSGLLDPWGSGEEFLQLFNGIQDELGCAFDVGEQGAGSFTESTSSSCEMTQCPGVHYCGIGNSSQGLVGTMFTVETSNTLNDACFTHDTCYFHSCIDDLICYFSPQSDTCDASLFDTCTALLGSGSYPLRTKDKAVCYFAAYYLSVGPFPSSCYDLPCVCDGCETASGECTGVSDFYFQDELRNIGTVDLGEGATNFLSEADSPLTDIAFLPDGPLLGISFNYLHYVDQKTGDTPILMAHSIPSGNGLIVFSDGTIYASGNTSTYLYKIDLSTEATMEVCNIGFYSAGDLSFRNGVLYMTSTTDELVRIIPQATPCGEAVGPIGFSDVFGLATGKNGILYGVSGTSVITIDTGTGVGTFLANYNGSGCFGNAYGATLRP